MKSRLILRVEPGALRAELATGEAISWAAEASFADAGELEQCVATIADELPPGAPRRVEVMVLQPMMQCRALSGLPPVRSNHLLNQLVGNHATRYFRRNGHPLSTSAIWAGRGRGHADAAAMETRWLDAIGRGLDTAGLTEGRITPAAPEFQRLTFHSADSRQRQVRLVRRTTVTLLLVGAISLLAALVIPAVRMNATRRHTAGEISALSAPAAAAERAGRALNGARDAVDSLHAARAHAPDALVVLTRLSTAVPDHAFLSSLDWAEDGRGTLTGGALRAVDVLAAMERHGIPGARLDGTPVPEAGATGARERFVIRFGSASGAEQ